MRWHPSHNLCLLRGPAANGCWLKDELTPYPGRALLVARMVIAASLVTIICMTFRIPYAWQGVVGVLLGLFMMWLVFDQLWNKPSGVELKRRLVSKLNRRVDDLTGIGNGSGT